MKKILFTMLAVLMATAQVQAQSTARVFLSHQGDATMFNGAEVADAIAAAVDGDTLYFSEGNFTGGFAIDKKLSLIGAGQSTVIRGDINVAIPDSVTLTSTLMQALYIRGSVTVSLPVNNMVMRQCAVTNNINLDQAYVSDVLLVNCFIVNLVTSNEYNYQMSVVNSWVRNVYNEALYYSFINCNIGNVSASGNFQGECVNCIVCKSKGAQIPASFTNTMYGTYTGEYSSNTTYVNCWSISAHASGVSWCEQIIEKWFNGSGASNFDLTDYKGTDGTVIGYHGGFAPYTLVPSTPKVTELLTEVGDDSKTLKVNVKLEAH